MATLTARIVKAWPIAASVAMLLAAFPPFNIMLLVFVALVPWLVSLRKASNWGAFRSGYLFGLLYMLGQMAWLQSLTDRWVHSLGWSLVPWFLSALVAGFYFATAGWLIRLCLHQGRPWLIPLAWVGVEVFRSFVPGLAFPWGLIATPLWSMPAIIQHAFYGTIYFVSAWVVLTNVIGAMLMEGIRFRMVVNYAMVWIVLLCVSLVRYSEPVVGEPVAITAFQPGVDLAFEDPAAQQEKLAANLGSLFARATLEKPRLIVMPEGLTAAGDAIPPPVPFRIPLGLSVIFGGQRGTDPVYQSAFAFDGRWQWADKRRLVVFGEYVPGRNWIPFLDRFKLAGADLTPSQKTSALDVNGIRVGPMLCFEGLFFDVAQRQVENKAQLLAVMSIDDWYAGTAAPEQLKVAAIWRAVETGLPVVRSASLGYSLMADARGCVCVEAPFGKAAALRGTLRVPKEPEQVPTRPIVPWLFLASCPVVWLLDRFWRKAAEPEPEPERSPKRRKGKAKRK